MEGRSAELRHLCNATASFAATRHQQTEITTTRFLAAFLMLGPMAPAGCAANGSAKDPPPLSGRQLRGRQRLSPNSLPHPLLLPRWRGGWQSPDGFIVASHHLMPPVPVSLSRMTGPLSRSQKFQLNK